MRGYEFFSSRRRASELILAANRRTGTVFKGLPRPDGYAGAVFEDPPLVY